MKALIFKNKVIQIEEKEFAVASELKWVDAPKDCEVNWVLKDNNLVAPEPEPELTYSEKRMLEYPSIKDLVVALYDTDDKSAIETKRAEIKKKYPKP